MTKIIGLTGGIGSGKSTIAAYLEAKGIPVYIADQKARELLDSDAVRTQIQKQFGLSFVANGKVNRKRLADLVFSNKDKLEQLNKIVHPAVEKDFSNWLLLHAHSPIVVKEAAILFESGSYKRLDAVINIEAPDEQRIARVMQRDGIARDEVIKRMNNQLTNQQRAALADVTIVNTNLKTAQGKVDDFLKKMNYF